MHRVAPTFAFPLQSQVRILSADMQSVLMNLLGTLKDRPVFQLNLALSCGKRGKPRLPGGDFLPIGMYARIPRQGSAATSSRCNHLSAVAHWQGQRTVLDYYRSVEQSLHL